MESIKHTDKVKVRKNKKQQKVINGYTVIGILGETSHSKVFLVKEKKKEFVNFTQAMKVVDMDYLSRQRVMSKGMNGEIIIKTLLDGVYNEIEINSKMTHQNIVKIFEVIVNEEKGKMYIIMEYCSKGSFLSWNSTTSTFHPLWSKFELTEDSIKQIFTQLVFAVYYLHSNYIVHFDLKPQNVLISENFTVKLADFDQACNLLSSLSLPKQPGTLQFFPPESISIDSISSSIRAKAVDVWGLGIILYSAVYGVLPFHGQNLDELFNSIKMGE